MNLIAGPDLVLLRDIAAERARNGQATDSECIRDAAIELEFLRGRIGAIDRQREDLHWEAKVAKDRVDDLEALVRSHQERINGLEKENKNWRDAAFKEQSRAISKDSRLTSQAEDDRSALIATLRACYKTLDALDDKSLLGDRRSLLEVRAVLARLNEARDGEGR